MKCPDCNSEKYSTYEMDPLLMGCEDCHAVHSTSWAIGYWVGFLEGKKIEPEQSKWKRFFAALNSFIDSTTYPYNSGKKGSIFWRPNTSKSSRDD